MSITPAAPRLRLLAPALLLLSAAPASAQRTPFLPGLPLDSAAERVDSTAEVPVFRTLGDSLAWARVSAEAGRARGRRLVVSLFERRLWWIDGKDTLFSAPVAVGKDVRLQYGDTLWNFSTPRGVRRVLGKDANPVWIPPQWHYVEVARDSGFALVRLRRGRAVRLGDGTRVVVRGERVGRLEADGSFHPVPADEEVIFGDTLFVPPLGTVNRRVAGELGRYKLELGDGYMIHGTPHLETIGSAATHGCIRMRDDDILYVYRHVPVGTPVFIY